MPSYDTLLYETRGPVALINLNRPEKLNAWTFPMENEFIDAVNFVARDPAVSVIVVTSASRAFCAGADIGAFEQELRGEASPRKHDPWMLQTHGSPEIPQALMMGKTRSRRSTASP